MIGSKLFRRKLQELLAASVKTTDNVSELCKTCDRTRESCGRNNFLQSESKLKALVCDIQT